MELKKDKIYLAFYREKKKWLDKIICWTSRGPYSHVELVIPEYGYSYSSSGRDGGVRAKNINKMHFNDEKKWVVYECNDDLYMKRLNKFKEFFRCHANDKYDWKSIILYHIFRIRYNKKDSNTYICSEFICDAIQSLYALKDLKDDNLEKEFKDYLDNIRGWESSPSELFIKFSYVNFLKYPIEIEKEETKNVD